MTFASHIFSESRARGRWHVAAFGGAFALAAGLAWLTFMDAGRAPVNPPVEPGMLAWRERAAVPQPDFTILRGPSDAGAATNADFLADFRFAGVFFIQGGSHVGLRRGVISYLPEKRQEIVSEGDVLAGVLVKRIDEDRIVLEKDGREGSLRLGGSGGSGSLSFLDETATAAPARRSRFGEQTGDGVWTLQKSELQAYYDELLDEPERMLQVFDSLAPLYDDRGRSIEGYQLRAVGEQAFFDAVGFREGDVVRKVNALPMTNRGRAEFFIRQVVQDRVSAIVIDIEREGTPKRLVYQLR